MQKNKETFGGSGNYQSNGYIFSHDASMSPTLLPPNEWECEDYDYHFDASEPLKKTTDDSNIFYSKFNQIPIFSEVVHRAMLDQIQETGWYRFGTADGSKGSWKEFYHGINFREQFPDGLSIKDDETNPNSYAGRYDCPLEHRQSCTNYGSGLDSWKDSEGEVGEQQASKSVGVCKMLQYIPRDLLPHVALAHINTEHGIRETKKLGERLRVRVKGKMEVTSAGLSNICWECGESAATADECHICNALCNEEDNENFLIEGKDGKKGMIELYGSQREHYIRETENQALNKYKKKMINFAEKEPELYYKQLSDSNIGFKRWTFHFCADTEQGFKVPLGMHKDVLDCRHLGITG